MGEWTKLEGLKAMGEQLVKSNTKEGVVFLCKNCEIDKMRSLGYNIYTRNMGELRGKNGKKYQKGKEVV